MFFVVFKLYSLLFPFRVKAFVFVCLNFLGYGVAGALMCACRFILNLTQTAENAQENICWLQLFAYRSALWFCKIQTAFYYNADF